MALKNLALKKQDAVLSRGGPSNAAVHFVTYICALNSKKKLKSFSPNLGFPIDIPGIVLPTQYI